MSEWAVAQDPENDASSSDPPAHQGSRVTSRLVNTRFALADASASHELPHFPASIGLGTLFLIAGIVFRYA